MLDKIVLSGVKHRSVLFRGSTPLAIRATLTYHDDEAAPALATIIRQLTPDDYADALTARGVDVKAWYRALDALSLQLPIETPAPPAGYPGSRADIGRRQCLRDELAYRKRLHPEPG